MFTAFFPTLRGFVGFAACQLLNIYSKSENTDSNATNAIKQIKEYFTLE